MYWTHRLLTLNMQMSHEIHRKYHKWAVSQRIQCIKVFWLLSRAFWRTKNKFLYFVIHIGFVKKKSSITLFSSIWIPNLWLAMRLLFVVWVLWKPLVNLIKSPGSYENEMFQVFYSFDYFRNEFYRETSEVEPNFRRSCSHFWNN